MNFERMESVNTKMKILTLLKKRQSETIGDKSHKMNYILDK